MRDNHANLSRCYVSGQKRERAINQPQAVDTLLMLPLGNLQKYSRAAPERPRLTGQADEPGVLDFFGSITEMPLEFPMLQYRELAFLLAYGLGNVSTETLTAGVYRHTITPLANRLDAYRDLPTLSLVQAVGGAMYKRLYASMGVDAASLDIVKNDWVKAAGSLKGTGYHQMNIVSEDVSGTNGAVSLTLAANAVQGSTAAERLASVHRVQFMLAGQSHWSEVACTAASGATPAVLTIAPPTSGGSASGTYRVLYVPAETASLATGSATSDPSYDAANDQSTLTDSSAGFIANAQAGRWLRMTSGNASGLIAQIGANTTTALILAGVDLYTAGVRATDTYEIVQFGWLKDLPSLVSEPSIRINDIQVILGGQWNGSSFSGGRAFGREINSLKWNLSNSLTADFLAGDVDYTSSLYRGQRKQTITFDRRTSDAIYQSALDSNIGAPTGQAPTMGLRVVASGPAIAGGYGYQAELIWPKVAIKTAASELDGEWIKETGELAVLSDDTYGPIIARITNTIPSFAA